MSSNTPNLEEVTALKELVAVIVDYYCFKNNDSINEDDEDEDSFMKNKYSENDLENQDVIPNEIDDLIKESFKNQLKKFIV